MEFIKERNFLSELSFNTTRSSGPGGQHVNKVSSKVELRFHIDSSVLLSEEEKLLIHKKLKNRVNNEGELILTSQSGRSQVKNKEEVINRFYELLEMALKPRKKRIKTAPPLASRIKRLEEKKRQSEKKENRKPPEI